LLLDEELLEPWELEELCELPELCEPELDERLRRRVVVTAGGGQERQQRNEPRGRHVRSFCSRRAGVGQFSFLHEEEARSEGKRPLAGRSRRPPRFEASRRLDRKPRAALPKPSDSAPMAQREDE
jgi:hypothetical protein